MIAAPDRAPLAFRQANHQEGSGRNGRPDTKEVHEAIGEVGAVIWGLALAALALVNVATAWAKLPGEEMTTAGVRWSSSDAFAKSRQIYGPNVVKRDVRKERMHTEALREKFLG